MPKILLVEDDKFICTIHKNKLAENSDWEVITAADGEEAIDKITNEQPDLILLDMMIPKKNGFEVLSEIKANPALATIPVIITSGLEQEADIKKGLELGAVDYLAKSSNTVDNIVLKVSQHLPS